MHIEPAKIVINTLLKYLNSSSFKFLANLSRLEFINNILSIKTILLIKVKLYFSNPFGITLILLLNLFNSLNIK